LIHQFILGIVALTRNMVGWTDIRTGWSYFPRKPFWGMGWGDGCTCITFQMLRHIT